MNETTIEQLRAIERAARRYVQANLADANFHDHSPQWQALVQALFDGRSLHERAMDQFNEQRDAAIKRTSAS
jgi:hypothetical protein